MGPALTRLFKDRAVRNQAGIEAHNKLGWIWDRHGEALIEKLERLHRECTASDFNEHWDSYTNVAKLLAQLESEAQP